MYTDHEVHEDNGHEEEKDEELQPDVVGKRFEVGFHEEVDKLNLAECHYDHVQHHRAKVGEYLLKNKNCIIIIT